jgi:hypothetical protein
MYWFVKKSILINSVAEPRNFGEASDDTYSKEYIFFRFLKLQVFYRVTLEKALG